MVPQQQVVVHPPHVVVPPPRLFNQSDLPDVMPPQMIGVPTGGGDYVKSNFSKTFPSEWVAMRGEAWTSCGLDQEKRKSIEKMTNPKKKRHRKVGKIKRKDDNIKSLYQEKSKKNQKNFRAYRAPHKACKRLTCQANCNYETKPAPDLVPVQLLMEPKSNFYII